MLSQRARTPQLSFLEPMECLLVSALPEGPEWAYEIKLDGYRAQALCDGKTAQLLSRNGKDIGHRFPALVSELASSVPPGTILDGELVALDASGKPNFSLIQNSATSGATFVFFAFDVLQLGGVELTVQTLKDRQELLRKCLKRSDGVQLSESFQIPAKQMLDMVREHGLEGVVAKRLSSAYEQGRRTGAWAKVRVELSQELVIGGYTPGTHGFDAVIVGFTEAASFTSVGASAMASCQPAAVFCMRNSPHSKRRLARL